MLLRRVSYNARMSNTQSDTWQGLLNVLTDPALVSAVGSILVFVATACSRAVRDWCSKKLNGYKHDKKIKEMEKHAISRSFLDTGVQIVKKLEQLRAAVDCSRVCILQFRNGSMFTLSKPIFRVYGSYESIRKGVAPSNNFFQELVATNVIDLLAPIIGNAAESQQLPGVTIVQNECPHEASCINKATCPRIVRFDVENLSYGRFRFMLEQAGVAVMYAAPLMSGNSPIGIIVGHFLQGSDAEGIVAPNLKLICDTVHSVQMLLDARYSLD